MARKGGLFASVFMNIRAIRLGPRQAPRAVAKVTVLLFLLGSHRTLHAQASIASDLRISRFRCEFRMPIGPGRVDGYMASDGRRERIAIYWMEPATFRESVPFLRCCDLILDHKIVHYWMQGMSQPGKFDLSDGQRRPLLPVQKSAESVLRSALAIMSHVRCSPDETDPRLAIATFFERSRGRPQFRYTVSANGVDGSESLDCPDSGAQILNTPPYGRQYSKETRDDGSMLWRAQKAANGQLIVAVTIRHIDELGHGASPAAFDVETLGRWTLIREPYRVYWSFARACETIGISSDVRTSARDLYGKLDSYLDQNKTPAEVGRGLDRVRFRVALMTADSNCVWRSAQAVVTSLCADEMVPKAQCIVDLGSMSGRIQEEYAERMEERLAPLVTRVVGHGGQDAATGLDGLMAHITNNGWFTYGKLLLIQMRRAGLIQQRDLDSWMARLQASRLARGGTASDPCDLTASTQRYLSQVEADPPKGELDVNDIRCILNEGLAKRYTPDQSEAKHEVIENAICLIRLIAGAGPFCGDPAELIPALDRFSRNCLQMYKTPASLDTILATVLALSFCDTSTTEDRGRLFWQFQSRSRAIQSQVNAMLAACGLAVLVTAEDVERTFQIYECRFRQYVDDPLWAPFKFPWTRDEEVRLEGAMRLRLLRLEPFLDEVAAKVDYGGTSAHLKDRTTYEISRVAQQLLPEAAFLRSPPYPGVSCQYRGGYGFAVMIRGPLYEGKRPKQIFRAMKYFHLGHRLQDIVARELQFAGSPATTSDEGVIESPSHATSAETGDDYDERESLRTESPSQDY
jgi:hypothetical protein